jgi:hypothetical protein
MGPLARIAVTLRHGEQQNRGKPSSNIMTMAAMKVGDP